MREIHRPGNHTEAVTPTIVANVQVFVNKDRTVTWQEVTNQLSSVKRRHIRFYTKN